MQMLECVYNITLKVSDADRSLQRHLLAICPERQKLKVNIHRFIPLLIRESDVMVKMNLPLPVVAQTLYVKQDYFNLLVDSLQVKLVFIFKT